MKILITSIIDLKKSQHNRPHQFVRHLCKNHDISIISINDWWKGSQNDLRSYSRDFDDIYDIIDYYYLTDRKVSPIIQEIFSNNKVKDIIKKTQFDVHLNYSTLISGYFATKNLKTVYDIADDLTAMIRESPQIPFFLRSIGAAFGYRMLKKNIKAANRITVTTENLIDTNNISRNKAEIISNGVDIDLFRDHGIGIKKKLGIEGFIIGYVGVLREWVDFEPIFSILKELNKDIKVVIVGKEGKFDENVELAKKYSVDNRIKFIGMIPYSQVPKYISAMDVCLIPFKKGAISENAVPLKLFEYMSCKRPVISSRLKSVENIANDKILFASNKEEYKEKITFLFENANIRKKMGIEGRKFVEKNYDWKKLTERLENVLYNLL